MTTSAHAQLEEIVVTATKRAESAQDIPVAIQAMQGDTMKKLGVATFDEYVKFLPNVVQQGRGPGLNEIYIRGVATEQAKNSVSSVQGSSPA
ncbi:MAG: TonB-dependent receptor plug domain-containing protein, partial [Gammaproteobacteria bacterium]|nr:TonB-dependent receptor plug domain-containing protein [Gammaproteobacteria bacterium]